MGSVLPHRAAKPLLFALALGPFAWYFQGALTDQLGANPAERLIHASGDWALRFLCLTLAVTPLRVILKRPALARFRRMLGLFCYFYAALHLLGYSGFDMGFDLPQIARDMAKRPFILVGFLGFLLLTLLAMTSFNAVIRRLGAARWKALHRLIHLAAALAILHFFWMRAGKNDMAEVGVYAALLGGLLGWRAWHAWARRRQIQ